MERLDRSRRITPLALLLVLIVWTGTAAAQSTPAATPIPTVAGPIPVTPESYPLMASAKLQTLVDLDDDDHAAGTGHFTARRHASGDGV